MCGNAFTNPIQTIENTGKDVAPIALPILGTLAAPGLGTALGLGADGLGLGTAALSGIGGALGGAAGGALNGGGLTGALTGAALGGGGGYLAGGGLSDLLGGTSVGDALGLSGDAGSASVNGVSSDGLNVGQAYDTPAVDAARSVASDAATSAAPLTTTLTGFLPGNGASVAGGGTSGGFLNLPSTTGDFGVAPLTGDSTASSLTSGTLPWQSASGNAGTFGQAATPSSFGVSPLNTDLGTFANAGAATPAANSSASGLSKMFSPTNLSSGALKSGLGYLLQNNNTGGYNALQGAQNQSAANYQPFLQNGTAATNQLANLNGLNGTAAAQAATQNWQNTPGYQFALGQGLNAIDAGAAQRGMLSSGNNLQAEQQYGTGLANQYYNQYLGNLQNQVGTGLTGAAGVGQGITGAANTYAQMKGNQGNNYNQMLGGLGNAFLPTNGLQISPSGNGVNLSQTNSNNGLLSSLYNYL